MTRSCAPKAAAGPSTWPRRARVLARRLDRAARGRHALVWLFFGSVVESGIAPWPIEFPLLHQMLKGRRHVAPATAVVALGSAVGALVAYSAGALALDAAQTVFAGGPTGSGQFAAAAERLREQGAAAVFLAMLAPVPVQIAGAAAGAAGLSPAVFFAAALAGRTVRYAAMGVPVYFFGDKVIAWWRRRPKALRRAGVFVLIALFIGLLAWTMRP